MPDENRIPKRSGAAVGAGRANTRARVSPRRELAPLVPRGLERGLRNYWYPVLQSEELHSGRPLAFRALDEALVAWRGADNQPNVVHNRCPHRGVQLSAGRVMEGDLQCIFHGLRFDGKGACTLIPWESERSKIHGRMRVKAYPAQELGGYVWMFLGDGPAPSLADEVPEELSHPDEFIWFRLPTQVWKTNWLLALDGSDAYHAVTLHANSQAYGDEQAVPLEDRRVRIVRTSHGIRGVSVDKQGNQIDHGHFTTDVKGERFVLPCLTTNPIVPARGVAPYAARLWQFPVDAEHTQVVRFLAWRARNPEERVHAAEAFQKFARPRLERVAAEDEMVAVAQGDLVTARKNERLLGPDADVLAMRKLIVRAFSAKTRPAIEARWLRYPV